MKIRNVNGLESNTLSVKSAEHPIDAHSREILFRRTMGELGRDQQTSALMLLAEEINSQGQKLSKRADVREFERYRALIKKFLDQVVSGSFEFSRESSFAARGRHRLFATVQTVNQKLEELAREILAGEAENLGILSRVDEIRGLLLDMLL